MLPNIRCFCCTLCVREEAPRARCQGGVARDLRASARYNSLIDGCAKANKAPPPPPFPQDRVLHESGSRSQRTAFPIGARHPAQQGEAQRAAEHLSLRRVSLIACANARWAGLGNEGAREEARWGCVALGMAYACSVRTTDSLRGSGGPRGLRRDAPVRPPLLHGVESELAQTPGAAAGQHSSNRR